MKFIAHVNGIMFLLCPPRYKLKLLKWQVNRVLKKIKPVAGEKYEHS